MTDKTAEALKFLNDCIAQVEIQGRENQAGRLRLSQDALIARLRAAEGLARAAKIAMPWGVCLTNTNVADSLEVPLLATIGELRALSAALAEWEKSNG